MKHHANGNQTQASATTGTTTTNTNYVYDVENLKFRVFANRNQIIIQLVKSKQIISVIKSKY